MYAYVLPGSGTVMLFTAIDRLYAVLSPVRYTGRGVRYALALMLTAYVCSTPTFLYCVVNAFVGFPPGTLVGMQSSLTVSMGLSWMEEKLHVKYCGQSRVSEGENHMCASEVYPNPNTKKHLFPQFS